jgi:hypothetical protein
MALGTVPLAGCCECVLPTFTAEQAKLQVGHFMRSGSKKAETFISRLESKGVRSEDIQQLRNDCADCTPKKDSDAPFGSEWTAFRVFSVPGGELTVIIQIYSCSSVDFEHSFFEWRRG